MGLSQEQVINLFKLFAKICCNAEELQWFNKEANFDILFGEIGTNQLEVLRNVIENDLSNAQSARKSKVCNVLQWILSEHVDEKFANLIEQWQSLDQASKEKKKQSMLMICRIPQHEQDAEGNFVLLEMAFKQVEWNRVQLLLFDEDHEKTFDFNAPTENDLNQLDTPMQEGGAVTADVQIKEVPVPPASVLLSDVSQQAPTDEETISHTGISPLPSGRYQQSSTDDLEIQSTTEALDTKNESSEPPEEIQTSKLAASSDESPAESSSEVNVKSKRKKKKQKKRKNRNKGIKNVGESNTKPKDDASGKRDNDIEDTTISETSSSLVNSEKNLLKENEETSTSPVKPETNSPESNEVLETSRSPVKSGQELTKENEDVYSIHFSVVFDEKFSSNCIRTIYWRNDDKLYRLNKLGNSDAYGVTIPCSKSSNSFEYKYVVYEKGGDKWEKFNQHSSWSMLNRELKISADQIANGHVFQYDVAIMGYTHCTEEKTADMFFPYLLNFKFGDDECIDKTEFNCWLKILLNDWSYSNKYCRPLTMSLRNFPSFLKNAWENNYFNENPSLVIMLVCIFINKTQMYFNRDILQNICTALDISKYDPARIQKIHSNLKHYQTKFKSELLNFQNATVKLFGKMESFGQGYMKIATLYWLLTHEKKVLPNPKNNKLIFAAMLPAKIGVNWNEVERKCHYDGQAQKEIVSFIKDGGIFQTMHGHLMKALSLFLLNMDSTISIIKDQQCIPDYFPIEMILMKLLQHWHRFRDCNIINNLLPLILNNIKTAQKLLNELEISSSKDKFEEGVNQIEHMIDLLKNISNRNNNQFSLEDQFISMAWCLNVLIEVLNSATKMRRRGYAERLSQGMFKNSLNQISSAALKKCLNKINHYTKQDDIICFLKILLDIKIPYMEKEWKEINNDSISQVIVKYWNDESDFFKAYADNLWELGIDILDQKAYDIMETSTNNPTMWDKVKGYFNYSSKMKDLMGDLFTKEFHKVARNFNYQRGEISENMLIDLMVKRPCFAMYIKILRDNNQSTEIKEYTCLISGLRKFMKQIKEGEIKIDTLNKITNSKKMAIFCELFDRLDKKKSDWGEIMSTRQSQCNMCNEFFEKLEFLQKLTERKAMGVVLGQFNRENFASFSLQQFVDVKTSDLIPLDTISHGDLNDIYKMRDSGHFFKIWSHHWATENKLEDDNVEMKEVLKNVWEKTKANLINLLDKIDDGSVCVQELTAVFKDMSSLGDPTNHCINELQILYSLKNVNLSRAMKKEKIPNIVAVIRNDAILERAHVLEEIIDILSLNKESFQGVYEILNISSASAVTLREISIDMGGVHKKLESLDEKVVEILKNFIQERDLIDYILEIGDFTQIQTLCDMALISVVEDKYTVNKIKAFVKISTEFGPLLFDLENFNGINDLITNCLIVYENYKSDETLSEKWNDCAQQLCWFKQIRDVHGSVERETIRLAQRLYETGRYKIYSEDGSNSVIRITITDDTDNIEEVPIKKVFELRDKLMLIMNEDSEKQRDIEGFVELFNSVEKISKSYHKLMNAGCLLFHNWSAEIWYSTGTTKTEESFFHHKINIVVKFGEKFKNMEAEGNIKLLISLNKIFVDSLHSWSKFIGSIRSKYYYLNFYTIRQICYLCKELATQRRADIPDQAIVLLSAVHPDVTRAEIADVLSKIQLLLNIQESIKFEDPNLQPKSEILPSDSNSEKRIKATETLVRQNQVSNKQAKAAVQCVGYDNLDDCVLWILENQMEHEMIEAQAREFDLQAGFTSQTNASIPVHKALLENSSNMTLKGIIKQLQSNSTKNAIDFLSLIKTIIYGFCNQATISLQDFLSFQHLGQLLQQLHDCASAEFPSFDLVQAGLKRGKPNLLFCQANEMFANVLSLYSLLPDHPLPSSSQVLVCSSLTHIEEIEEFLKRAIFCKNENVYCMAYSEKLSFNVSAQMENVFEKLLESSFCSKDYQLVILSASKQHYIAGCFEKYAMETRILQSPEVLQKYLCDNLKMTNDQNAPANVENDCSSVQVISSTAAGAGKSLLVKRIREKHSQYLEKLNVEKYNTVVRLVEKTVDISKVVDILYSQNSISVHQTAHIIHIDITPAAKENVDEMMFKLLVLGTLVDAKGKVWKKVNTHLYLIEKTFTDGKNLFDFLRLLPNSKCNLPSDSASKMDDVVFQTEEIQRPYQYLKAFDEKVDLDAFNYVQSQSNGSADECVQVLLKHFPLKTPTWAQLVHFAHFMNVHLKDCERSIFCNVNLVGSDSGLNGLKSLVVASIVNMAQDFCTPSLDIADESFKGTVTEVKEEFERHQLRRKWETDPHPYVFFNHDGNSMTFLNFVVRQNSIVDINGNVISVLPQKYLADNLRRNGVNLNMDLNKLPRNEKLEILCKIVGVDNFDPDTTFELTADNVLKILALYMRFRCGMPVVLMGETGCGKTRMIEFLNKLLAGPKHGKNQIYTMKVHGGITAQDIYKEAELVTQHCKDLEKESKSAILFFDEANTTEAIFAIKELVCDKTINGVSFRNTSIQVIAACNPYKKLSKEALQNLVNSGLGYRVKEEDTEEKIGNIAMRKLVYRVVALPPSIQPFAWDFGQLTADTERKYIDQMCKKLSPECDVTNDDVFFISAIITASQEYMKGRNNECHYVSMRDIERCIKVFKWFHKLFTEDFLQQIYNQLPKKFPRLTKCQRCLLHSLNVCYYVSLHERANFMKMISENLRKFNIHIAPNLLKKEFSICQDVFLTNLRKEENIALNEALKENIFVLAVCIDNRIPLFLIGKPGSSKSLAKTLIGDNMQGTNSQSKVFQKMKQTHMVSFQCSALTDAVGIEGIFRQCVQLQAEQNLEKYTSVVVLDEIGLAEDSPKMPLKVLHPLLETGTTKNSTLSDPDTHKKVAFVGISNWALDPAKMNRGIFVTRQKPKSEQLIKTAEAIFNQEKMFEPNQHIIRSLTRFYEKIYEEQEVEFFGLRDYYSLIKMIYTYALNNNQTINIQDVYRALQRNFSGGKTKTNVVQEFRKGYRNNQSNVDEYHLVPVQELVRENIKSNHDRFLLFLTTQYNAVYLLDIILKDSQHVIIFGSSFTGDQNYMEIYRNINQIKACMETGRMVILLNLGNLYESLYDALNQHYVTFGGERFVDIGLGGNRIKCSISKNFRLIVIEDQETVYIEFPIPLINRLEKYCIDSKSLLDNKQSKIADMLRTWINSFSKNKAKEIFIGYHEDMLHSLVLIWDNFESCKRALLQTATPDAVLRNFGRGSKEATEYFQNQIHDSLLTLLTKTYEMAESNVIMVEVTSFSQLLNNSDRQLLQRELCMENNSVMLLTLQQFNTQIEFVEKLKQFQQRCEQNLQKALLIVQCQSTEKYSKLYESSKYVVNNIMNNTADKNVTVVTLFVALTSRITGENHKLILPVSKKWQSIYIDELKVSSVNMELSTCYKTSFHQILDKWHKENDILERLLLDCLADAMDLIDDDHKRSLKRIQILGDSIQRDHNREFRKLLLQKLLYLSQKREALDLHISNNWALKVATSQNLLNENGAYQKALWMHSRTIIAKLIAFIVSISDVFQNLNHLDSMETTIEKDIWLNIFEMNIFSQLDWNELHERAQKYKLISMRGGITAFRCNFPFSHLVYSQFEGKINDLVTLSDQNLSDKANTISDSLHLLKKLFKSFRPNDRSHIVKAYAHDFVKFKYISETTHHQLFTDILMAIIVNAKKDGELWQANDMAKLHLILPMHVKKFNLLDDLLSAFPEILTEIEKSVSDQENSNEFILLDIALIFLLRQLKYQTSRNKQLSDWRDWSACLQKASKIMDEISIYVTDANVQLEANELWKKLKFVHSFLSVVPSEKLKLELVSQKAHLLWKGLENQNIHSLKFLLIVIKSLEACCVDHKTQVLTKWRGVNCHVCGSLLRKPVCFPCNHHVCKACLPRDEIECPSCDRECDTDDLVECTFSAEDIKSCEDFTTSGTSFFLEYLFTNIFNTANPAPENAQNIALNSLLSIIDEDIKAHAQQMELKFLNWNQTSTNIVLSKILDFQSQQDADHHSHNIVSYAVKSRKLQIAIIHAMESNVGESNTSLKFILNQVKKYINCSDLNLDVLKAIANIRFWLRKAVEQTKTIRMFNPKKQLNHMFNKLLSVCNEVKNHDRLTYIKKYMIKLGCHLHGTQWLKEMCKNNLLRTLIPPDLQNANNEKEMDYFTLLGSDYTDFIKQLHTTKDPLKSISSVLAGDDTKMKFIQIISAIQWALEDDVKQNFEKLATLIAQKNIQYDFEPLRYIFKNQVLQNHLKDQPIARVLQKFLILVDVILQSSKRSILDDYHLILQKPQNMPGKFLPGMLVSRFFRIPSEMAVADGIYKNQNHVYKCPNGHIYTIGDCGRPAVYGKCSECQMVIGGQGYIPARGNESATVTPESQSGYNLQNKLPEMEPAAERLSQPSESISTMHFLLHATFLLSSVKHERHIRDLLKVEGSLQQFLLCELTKNFNEMQNALNKNMDDTIVFLILLCDKLICCNVQMQHPWDSIENRELWEKQFYDDIVRPTVQNLTQNLVAAKEALKQANENCNVKLYKLLSENHEPEEMVFWQYRIHLTSDHFFRYLHDHENANELFIYKLMIKLNKLEQLEFLADFVRLQKHLIDRYNYQLDLNVAEKLTFNRYLHENDIKFENSIQQYIKMWNKYSSSIPGIPPSWHQLSMESSVTTAMPNARGKGRYAKMFIEYFIRIQNDFIDFCANFDDIGSIQEINVDQVLPSRLCHVNKDSLEQIIKMHTMYNVVKHDSGVRHDINYNLDAIEKAAKEKFIMFKKRISLKSIPLITYPQEMEADLVFEEIKTKQQALSMLMERDVDELIHNASIQELCEAVNTTTLVVHYISKVHSEPSKLLHDYLEKDLLLSSSRYECIPKSCRLHDAFALHQRLSWHRSITFAKENKNPFEDILDKDILMDLNDSERKSFLKFLERVPNLNVFQKNFSECITKAALQGFVKPDWKIVTILPDLDTMCNYLDENGYWFKGFPDELCFKHVLHAFILAAQFDQRV